MRLAIGIACGAAALLLSTGVCLAAADEKAPAAPGFTTLKEAVAFIAACLEQGAFDRLAAACADKDKRPNKALFEWLQQSNRKTPLTKLYEGREFPADKDTFKLGGHASELGYTHIDFTRKDGVWRLDAIWLCR